MTNVTNSMHETRTRISIPYSEKISMPLVDTAVYTRPMIPKGAKLMISLTMSVTSVLRSPTMSFVDAEQYALMSNPLSTAQNRMPR